MLLILLGGIATAFNFVIILHKLRRGRVADSVVDIASAVTLGAMFVGTLTGMAIAMVASVVISIYLWFYPVMIFDSIKTWMKHI